MLKVIRSHCEPPDIELDVKEVSLRKKPIVLIEVKEGKKKPYFIRDKGHTSVLAQQKDYDGRLTFSYSSYEEGEASNLVMQSTVRLRRYKIKI